MWKKYYILSLMLSCCFLVKAQVTETDAEAALINAIKTTTFESFLPQARQQIIAYEKQPFCEELIMAYGRLAFTLYNLKDSTWANYTEKATALANTHFNDEFHPSNIWANWAKAFFLIDTEEGPKLMKKALEGLTDKNERYFLLKTSYLITLTEGFRREELAIQITELTTLFDIRPDLEAFKAVLFFGKTNLALLEENYEQVIAYANQALAMDEKRIALWEDIRRIVMTRLIYAYGQLGQFEQAKALCFKSIDNTTDSYTLGQAYLSLSSVYDLEPNLERAIYYAERAIVEIKKSGEVGNLGVTLYNLATSKLRYDDIKGAKENMQEAFKYLRPSFHFALYNLEGRILAAENNYPAALVAAQKALVNVCTSFDLESPEMNPTLFDIYTNRGWAVHILYRKAFYQATLGRQSGNVVLMQQAQQTSSLTKALATDGLSDLRGFELSQYFSISNRFVNSALELETQLFLDFYHLNTNRSSLQNAFLALEKKKAAGLVKSIAQPTLPDDFTQRLHTVQQKLVQAQQAVDRAEGDSISHYQEELLQRNEEMTGIVEELRKNYPLQSDYYYAIPYVNIDQAKSLLSEGMVLVNYFMSQEKTYAFVLTRSSEDIISLPVDNLKELTEKVDRYLSLLKSPFLYQYAQQKEFTVLGNELYEALLAPLASNLKGNKKLLIIPDNGLSDLPFESLLSSPVELPISFDAMPFLLKDYEVSYHYSATAYSLVRKREHIDNQSLLAFAPVFNDQPKASSATRSLPFAQDSLMRSIFEDAFVPLPATREEVKKVSATLPTNAHKVLLLDKAATKTAILSAISAEPFQYIHIATHGFANLEDVLHSGLACNVSNDSPDDLLFISEVQFSPVRADLVVLSSCDSGVGKIAGSEGMLSFNRAFIYAGANNVISTLWRINDRYSSELMIHFYSFLAKGDDYGAALRKAKLQLLSDANTSIPRNWAPFILMGE
ncbi:MAG: CHAT domain-containing protein [Lewinella sp.]|uniref:CHAT domain-containing protein n=1 Tax=Lewinella sp. TaxID=2004506 RepID=UPI003D6C08B5